MIPNVLTIAGVDPSGGAGVITALTAQNTRGVTGVHPVPVAFIAQQIDTLFADVRIDSLKLGMLGTADIVTTVADALHRHGARQIVVDPVMVAKSGHHLLAPDAVEALRRRILPLAGVLTPNLPEAGVLLGTPEPRSLDAMRAAARALLQLGPRAVLLKGGHLDGPESVDLYDDGTAQLELRAPRIPERQTILTNRMLILFQHLATVGAIRAHIVAGFDTDTAARLALSEPMHCSLELIAESSGSARSRVIF